MDSINKLHNTNVFPRRPSSYSKSSELCRTFAKFGRCQWGPGCRHIHIFGQQTPSPPQVTISKAPQVVVNKSEASVSGALSSEDDLQARIAAYRGHDLVTMVANHTSFTARHVPTPIDTSAKLEAVTAAPKSARHKKHKHKTPVEAGFPTLVITSLVESRTQSKLPTPIDTSSKLQEVMAAPKSAKNRKHKQHKSKTPVNDSFPASVTASTVVPHIDRKLPSSIDTSATHESVTAGPKSARKNQKKAGANAKVSDVVDENIQSSATFSIVKADVQVKLPTAIHQSEKYEDFPALPMPSRPLQNKVLAHADVNKIIDARTSFTISIVKAKPQVKLPSSVATSVKTQNVSAVPKSAPRQVKHNRPITSGKSVKQKAPVLIFVKPAGISSPPKSDTQQAQLATTRPNVGLIQHGSRSKATASPLNAPGSLSHVARSGLSTQDAPRNWAEVVQPMSQRIQNVSTSSSQTSPQSSLSKISPLSETFTGYVTPNSAFMRRFDSSISSWDPAAVPTIWASPRNVEPSADMDYYRPFILSNTMTPHILAFRPDYPGQDTRTFHPFLRLPLELQDQIWQIAVDNTENNPVVTSERENDEYEMDDAIIPICPPPSLLHVNSRARYWAGEKWLKRFNTTYAKHSTYFNYDTDQVFINLTGIHQLGPIVNMMNKFDIDHIIRLALPLRDMMTDPGLMARFVSKFHRLKSLELLYGSSYDDMACVTQPEGLVDQMKKELNRSWKHRWTNNPKYLAQGIPKVRVKKICAVKAHYYGIDGLKWVAQQDLLVLRAYQSFRARGIAYINPGSALYTGPKLE